MPPAARQPSSARPASAQSPRTARPLSARASPRRPFSAANQRPGSPGSTSYGEGSQGKQEDAGPPPKPEWKEASRVGRNFGDPPDPLLSFLQPPPLCAWQESVKAGKDITINDVGRFKTWDGVALLTGTTDLNTPGRPPRPRSAVILKKALADLKVPPTASQPSFAEAIYLLHCDSTDTTLARGPDVWVPEKVLGAKPLGAGRDFCSDGRSKFSKKYGGIVGRTFDSIREEEERLTRLANEPPAPPEPRKPLASSGASKRSGWKPEHEHLWEGVPKLRRRKFCPPQARVRTSPRRFGWRELGAQGQAIKWVSSGESPRSRIMIGDLDIAPPPSDYRDARRRSLRSSDDGSVGGPGGDASEAAVAAA